MARGDSRKRSRSGRRGSERDRRDDRRDKSRGRDRGGGGRSRSRGRDRDRDRSRGRGGDKGRRRSRSRSKSRSRSRETKGGISASKNIPILKDKKKSGWDTPPPGMVASMDATVAPPALGDIAPQMPQLGALAPEQRDFPLPPGAPGAGAAPKVSSIQAALEAQQKMLAAKAGGMSMLGAGQPPPPPPEVAQQAVDTAITLAIAKAKALALRTSMEQDAAQAALGGPGPALGHIGGPGSCLPPGMTPVPPLFGSPVGALQGPWTGPAAGCFGGPCGGPRPMGGNLVRPRIVVPPGGMRAPVRPGMISMTQTMRPVMPIIQPGLSALSPLGSTKAGGPSIPRGPCGGPMMARGKMPAAMPVASMSAMMPKAPPFNVTDLLQATVSKGSMPKQPSPLAAPPPTGAGFGDLAGMKEVSPALAALMQGGLF